MGDSLNTLGLTIKGIFMPKYLIYRSSGIFTACVSFLVYWFPIYYIYIKINKTNHEKYN